MKRIALILVLLVASALAVPLIAGQDPEADKDWFVQFVEGQLSAPDRQIALSGIDGVLSSKVTIPEITVSDEKGVWLRIANAQLDWDQGALLGGTLKINALSADRVDYLRPAVKATDTALPAPEAGQFDVPKLPVAVELDALSVPSVTFGDQVFGLGSEISIAGRLKLADGSLDTALDIVRKDGPGGTLGLKLKYDRPSEVADIDLRLTEPKNGLIVNMLGMDGKPDVSLHVAGSGPLSALTTNLDLVVGGKRALGGTARLERVATGIAVDAALRGPIADLVPAAYKPFFGAETVLTTKATIRDAGGFAVEDFVLTGGQLAVTARADTSADGFLTRLVLGADIAGVDRSRVLLPGGGEQVSLSAAHLGIDYGDGGAWTARLDLADLATADLAAARVTLKLSGAASDLSDPARRRVTFNGDGVMSGITSADKGLAEALGGEMGLGIAGLWSPDAALKLAQLRLGGRGFDLDLAGVVRGLSFEGDIALAAPNLAAFSSLAERPLGGGLDLKAKGRLDALGGGFDLVLDGRADDLAVGMAPLDAVLAGPTTLSGRVKRDDTGLAAEGFMLASRHGRIAADGRFASDAADFRLTLALDDLGVVSQDAGGVLTAEGTAKGADGRIALSFDARLTEATLADRAVREARLGFGGQLDGGVLAGTLSGTGRVDGHQAELTAGLFNGEDGTRLSDLKFSTLGTLVTGSLLRDDKGFITGRLDLKASDVSLAAALLLVKAEGAATASIVLAPADGAQGATIEATASGLGIDSLVRIGSARITAGIADLFGHPEIGFDLKGSGVDAPAIAGYGLTPLSVSASGRFSDDTLRLATARADGPDGVTLTASGTLPLSGTGGDLSVRGNVPLAAAARLTASRGTQFSGTLSIDARVTGSLATPAYVGTVTTTDAGVVDPLSNLRLEGLSASARLTGDAISLERFHGALATGGTLDISGTVALAEGADLPADLTIVLDRARYADGTLFVATASGRLALTGALLDDPLLSGEIRLEKAEIAIPDSLDSDAALLKVDNRAPPPGVAATLDRIAGNAGGAGGGAAGTLRLDVTVAAPNQVFVRGRGVDAELGGTLRLTGPVDAIEPVGGFDLIRGRLSLLGQRITFESGAVTFTGNLDPTLDFRATTPGDGLTVIVTVRGPVSDLDIGFSSSPDLPQDEVLAQLVFRRSLGDLSPLQLARLAAAAAELAGGGSSSLVDSLRGAAGLADLDVITDAEGNTAVRAGTYLQDNVYVGVEAGTSGKSRVSIDLNLTDTLKASGSTTSDGESSVGLYYETDF